METPNPPPQAPERVSKAAVVAIVLSLLGFCIPPLMLIGAGVGIYALVSMGQDKSLTGKPAAIIAIAVLPFAFVVWGILAAIAIPNFIKFQSRAKQAECRTNLKAIFVDEQAYRQEHGAYSANVSEIGFDPEPNNRYAYFLGTGPMVDRSQRPESRPDGATSVGVDTSVHPGPAITVRDVPPLVAGVPLGVSPEAFTAVCVGRITSGGGLDVWSISSIPRTAADGEAIPAGSPNHDLDALK